MKTLAEHIKQSRLSMGLRTIDLAKYLNINQALISKYENDKRIPTQKQIIQLSEFLDLEKRLMLVLHKKAQILKHLEYDQVSFDAINLVKEELTKYQIEHAPKPSKEINKILDKIDLLKSKLDSLRHLDSYRIAEALEIEFTYESNKIEGNTLTLQETDLVINEGLTISGKSMREHLEAINHNDAINFVKEIVNNDTPITENIVLQIHNLVLRGISKEYAGKYRNVQVMIKGSSHKPPQAYLVPKQMEEFFLWYQRNVNILHPVLLAAQMHLKLVTIHPFIDGNGRTSRLLMNLILLRNGYTIANIKGDLESRMQYYKCLENAQSEGEEAGFHNLVFETALNSLKNYLDILQE